MNPAIIAISLIFILFCIQKVLAVYQRVKFLRKTLEGINCPPVHWFFGHIGNQKTASEELYLKRSRPPFITKYPKLSVRWFGFMNAVITLYYPSVVQDVLKSEEPKDPFVYGTIKRWIGEGLLISKGAKWRRNRKLLTGAFHFNMLKKYLKVFNETVDTMCDKWKDKSTVLVFENVSLMTLDSILQCAMSTKTNCQYLASEHQYIKAVYDLSEISGMRFFSVLLSFDFIFYNFSSLGRKFLKACKIAHDQSDNIIMQRKQTLANKNKEDESKSMDFLDILLLARDEKGNGLSDREIRDEVDTFLFEGHDTTASGIAWAMYNLAAHQDLQEKCRLEVNEILGSREYVEYDDVNKLEYLTMFIKESLRMYSPVFSISRQFSKPLRFTRGFGSDQLNIDESVEPSPDATRTFPASVSAAIRIFGLHRNPHVWENPDTFNPDRFLPENVANRSPFAYIPFSAGPRNCIGQNFAMMEMKVALALCLKRFRLQVDENFPKPEIYPAVILKAKDDIHLKLELLGDN